MSDQQYNQDNLSNDLQNASIGGGQQQRYDPTKAPAFTPNVGASSFVPQQAQEPQYGNQYQQPQQFGQYGNQQYGQNQSYNNYNGGRGGYGNNTYNNGGRGGYNNYNNNTYNNNNYNNNYNTAGAYNAYSGYQAPQANAKAAMSLADYQKQQQSSQASLNKPVKKTLKLDSSSGIKIANAPKPVEKPVEKVAEKAAEEPETKSVEEAVKEETKPAEKLEAPVVEVAKTEVPEVVAPTPVPAVAAQTKVETPKASTPAPASSGTATPVPSISVDALIKEQEQEVDAEVVNDMFGGKDHVSIIFMGHVDAGKSTMGGNILYLCDAVDKRTVEKYEREAKDAGRQGWYLSWIMDTNKEERSDGKTIEVGKAYFETDKRRYTILDAPGHKMYVSEMIGGASQADVGILVISARKGEYETGFEKGGQTREHALLAKTQGVNKLVVAVNKMDDPTVNWSKERYDECTSKLAAFLRGVGYAKEDVVFMPVSGFTGAGLKERISPKDCPWYKGESLLEYLDNMKVINRLINGPFMLPISGKLKDMGTVVEGKIESGHLKRGNSLLLMPNKALVEVLTIYNETEAEAETAYCGEQVRLRIKGVEEEDLSPGFVLTSPKAPVKTVTRFEAQIAIVELKSILSAGFSCVMHVHTAIEEVTITQLKHKLQKGTNKKSKTPPAFAKKGMKIIAILETTDPVCVETYEDYPQLGRFTLRDQGTTIAIGKITKLL